MEATRSQFPLQKAAVILVMTHHGITNVVPALFTKVQYAVCQSGDVAAYDLKAFLTQICQCYLPHLCELVLLKVT